MILVRMHLAQKRLRSEFLELKRDQQRQSTAILALHGAMKTISEDVIAHGQAQSSVRRTLDRLADLQSQMQLREVDEGLYPQAIRLIQSGRGREEVRRLCSLTESEADLLFSLHGPGTTLEPGARTVSGRG
ncbi:hypothetical protein D779_2505 [Imhoffiella purpurea]|uniref:DUF2802 domain-containing protein n=1 Tax=Imhoffiella purpurea TaxID=1249627 RepID=W9VBU8_9GAMM|nr:hypothetical protein D779_2505 [Imhoffiella purpurea]